MGLATQMIGRNEDFCRQLADAGFHVVRYDRRDAGRSTHRGRRSSPKWCCAAEPARYTLDDMADDAVGLLDHLGVERAPVCGASMGGMIAQTVALRHPQRVLSLVSIMSNTGARFSGQPAFALYPVLFKTAPREREAFAEHVATVFDKIGSPGFDHDVDEIRNMALLSYDRGRDPAGPGRQLAAIIASPDRTKQLGKITAPTLVIHGKADKLVRPSGGRATARRIPGARLMEIHGMGHDLPRAAWPRIIDGIAENARRAGLGVTAQTAVAQVRAAAPHTGVSVGT